MQNFTVMDISRIGLVLALLHAAAIAQGTASAQARSSIRNRSAHSAPKAQANY